MTNLTLEQLIQEDNQQPLSFGTNTGNTKGPYKSPYEIGKAYTVRIDSITGATNNPGYAQMEVSLSIVMPDGTVKKGGKEWLNLSEQGDEIKATLGEQYAEKMGKNHKKLASFFAAFSEDFRAYGSVDKSSWTFYDVDGNVISDAALKQRKDKVAKALSAVIRHLGTVDNTLDFMNGAEGVKVVVEGSQPNRNGQMPTFSNFYSSMESAVKGGAEEA